MPDPRTAVGRQREASRPRSLPDPHTALGRLSSDCGLCAKLIGSLPLMPVQVSFS